MNKKILILTDWFYPGKNAGGPIRSVVNFITHFEEEMDIHVLTRDRDFQEDTPYPGIKTDEWLNFGRNTRVMYLSPNFSIRKVLKILNQLEPDFLYLQSLFSIKFTLWPLLLSRTANVKGEFVLAPRGMLQEGALKNASYLKKKLFLRLFKNLISHKNLRFQATDNQELQDIQSQFPKAKIFLAGNLPSPAPDVQMNRVKKKGGVNMVFLSRINPKKNLDFLLKLLGEQQGTIKLDIWGPIEDKGYWANCESQIASLPSNVTVTNRGKAKHEDVPQILSAYHFFILPTKGENYGHAIVEALQNGLPVLISDKTPWQANSDHNFGWVLPLQDPEIWKKVIGETVEMGNAEYEKLSKSSIRYIKEKLNIKEINSNYKVLFS